MSTTPVPVPKDQAAAATGAASTAPLIALGCVVCVFFLIASMIVLALIPVYTQTKNAGAAVGFSQYGKLSQSAGVPGYGAASSDACSAIANGMNSAGGLSSGSLSSSGCSFASSSSGRRRRAWSMSRTRRQGFVFCIIKLKVRGHSRGSLKRRLIGRVFSATFIYFSITYTVIFTILGFSDSEPSGFSTSSPTATTTASSVTSAPPSG